MSDAESQVLSDEEKAALTDANQTEDVAAAEGLMVIDFSSQERVVSNQFPVLDRIHERFTRSLAERFYDMLGKEFEIQMKELQVAKFSEYMCSLKKPSGINVIRLQPLRGKAMIVFEAELLFSLVDSYFGGTGTKQNTNAEQEFSPTERRIMQIFLQYILEDLIDAWKIVINLQAEFVTSEANPQLVNIAVPSDTMLVAQFDVVYDNTVNAFHIVIPYSMLEPVREQLAVGTSRSDDDIDPNWSKSLQEELLAVPLQLHSRLVETKLNLSKVMNLKAGDIIPVELPETITLNIENIPSFIGTYGVSRDKCAIKIAEIMKR